MIIDSIMFNNLNQPLCPKCGEVLTRLAVMIKIPTEGGNLYGVTCTKCGGRMLARDEKDDEKDSEE